MMQTEARPITLNSSSEEIRENPNLLNLLENQTIDKSGHSSSSQKKAPKHSSRRKPGNVYLEKDGSSLFEKESSSTVNVFETTIVVPAKSIPSKARTTAHNNQFVKKNEKTVVEDEEDFENNEEIDSYYAPQRNTLGDFFSSNNKKSQSQSNSNSNQQNQALLLNNNTNTISADEIIAMVESVLSQTNVEKKDIESLKHQIQQKCSEIEDEQKMAKLLELAEVLNAF